MPTELPRPFRPTEPSREPLHVFQLGEIEAGLRREEAYERSGLAGVTLTRDDHVTLVLTALRKGAVLREHHAPSSGAALLLSGRAVFVSGDPTPARRPLGPGSLAVFSAELPHSVEALEDSLCLITIGGRTRSADAAHHGT